MKKVLIAIVFVVLASSLSLAQMGRMMEGAMHEISPINYDRDNFNEGMRISRGGQLYDNWWKATVYTVKPEGNHPLWKKQTTNTRSGYSTFRCKECHGWDYRGKDGAYGKGSHYTGFAGVIEVAQKMSKIELESVLKGSKDKDHNFIQYLSNTDISDLALFLKKGVIDVSQIVNSDGTPVNGNINSGSNIFMNNCAHMCHGGAGTMINFGEREQPEYVGTIANKNPWEFIHKVRNGQPGTRMPSAIINTWREKDIRDLLSFARTLPTDTPQRGWFDRMKGAMGFGMRHHEGYIPNEYRGFGPIIDQ